ncbi:OB-fold domain-containing protein [Bradyrhizobium sp. Pear77]|uniref:Zn-ribbon domain-containing OB-fold protein n=1 Tax=Bradyrhizobium TaxID=374 RepID=UPI001E3C3234|nr:MULTISPECIES: OB-fold domain-containing protein [Bradyrhizobium]MCC8958122.1 OB-fold domain-containing protein [Bradyrhizobium altum]MCC8967169.1 OB-fold domain-containing protein [Bradyrhizobium oropedii]
MIGTKEIVWTGPVPSTVVETKPFWDACNRGIFLVQRCRDCGETQYHYRGFCCHCWSDAIEDLAIEGAGKVWTFSRVLVNRSPQFAQWGVYVTGVVELPEGVKVISRILAENPETIQIGTPVRLAFARAESGQKIPLFVVQEGAIG